MKKISTFSRLLIAAGLALAGFAPEARANHVFGSVLTYVNVAPNVYVVNLTLYRNCYGLSLPASRSINFQAPGCDATVRNLTLNRSSQMAMEPYCAGVV